MWKLEDKNNAKSYIIISFCKKWNIRQSSNIWFMRLKKKQCMMKSNVKTESQGIAVGMYKKK